ncbi:MAG: hypothetical protein ACE5KM_16250 [Planctomycetaceae bacterium]
MTTQLSDEQRSAVQQHGDRPVEVVDPGTQKRYVLIAREQYERLMPLFEEEPLSRQEQRDVLQRAGRRAGWDDPEMDAYDRYDDFRSENS